MMVWYTKHVSLPIRPVVLPHDVLELRRPLMHIPLKIGESGLLLEMIKLIRQVTNDC